MKAQGLQPSVEPLSRQAWERVESRLFERLGRGEHLPSQNITVRGPAPVRIWLGAAALALAATVLLWLGLDLLHHDKSPVVATTPHTPLSAPHGTGPHGTASQGTASQGTGVSAAVGSTRAEAHAEGHAAAQAAALQNESARISTTSAATRTTLGETELTLAAESDVRVTGSDAQGWLVELLEGRVDCEVSPRRGRPAFVVQAGETRVSVIGTRFSVERAGESARVSVREGHVRVEDGNTVILLGAGERWPEKSAVPPPIGASKSRSRAVRRNSDPLQESFDRAALLEASDPDAAARIYANLSKTRGPWAANALYAEARLELGRGHTERARALLQRYLTRYPKGVNARDVRALLAR